MLQGVSNLYKVQDLNGEFLLQPLKAYHGFFAKKIQNSSGCQQLAYIIANIVTGIFAYPAFGLVAGIGMLIKLAGIPGVRNHNENQKKCVESLRADLKNPSNGYFDSSGYLSSHSEEWEMVTCGIFKVSRKTCDEQCDAANKEIDLQSGQFRKVYYRPEGSVKTGTNNEITVKLCFWQKVIAV